MTAARSAAVAAAAVPVAFVAANAVSYALLLAAAHVLDAADYGKLSSLLGLLLISSIPMLALQTVTARRVATEAGTAGIVRGTALVGGLAAAIVFGLSPALAAFLHLPSVAGILLVAGTIPASAVLGTAMGVAQGRRHFLALAALILVSTGGRSAGGLIGLLVGRTPGTTLVGVLIGTGVAGVLVAASGRGIAGHRDSLRDRTRVGVVHETLHAGHALGTFLLLTSLDVLLARHVLTETQAGAYAVGSVITRAAVWLPQSVITLMFASLSESDRHRDTARRAGLAVVSLGVVVVAVSALFGPLAVTVVGGRKYHSIDGDVWLYALLGSLLAVLQLSVLAGLAQRRARRVALLWLTIAVDVGLVLATGDDATPTRVVLTLVLVTSVAAVAALILTVGPDRDRSAQDAMAGDGTAADGATQHRAGQDVAPDGHAPGV